MKKLLILSRFSIRLCFVFLSVVVSVHADEMNTVLIKTIDKNNQPIKAEIVKWWFSDTPQKKKKVECIQGNCSEWFIQNKQSQAIDIYAFASKERGGDPYCWDWFEGEVKNQVAQKEINVTLTYSSTVCK